MPEVYCNPNGDDHAAALIRIQGGLAVFFGDETEGFSAIAGPDAETGVVTLTLSSDHHIGIDDAAIFLTVEDTTSAAQASHEQTTESTILVTLLDEADAPEAVPFSIKVQRRGVG